MPDHNLAAILDTVEAFLDTCPYIPEDTDITFGKREFSPSTAVAVVTIGGVAYLVNVSRVG